MLMCLAFCRFVIGGTSMNLKVGLYSLLNCCRQDSVAFVLIVATYMEAWGHCDSRWRPVCCDESYKPCSLQGHLDTAVGLFKIPSSQGCRHFPFTLTASSGLHACKQM